MLRHGYVRLLCGTSPRWSHGRSGLAVRRIRPIGVHDVPRSRRWWSRLAGSSRRSRPRVSECGLTCMDVVSGTHRVPQASPRRDHAGGGGGQASTCVLGVDCRYEGERGPTGVSLKWGFRGVGSPPTNRCAAAFSPTEQAADAAVDQACRLLRLPAIRSRTAADGRMRRRGPPPLRTPHQSRRVPAGEIVARLGLRCQPQRRPAVHRPARPPPTSSLWACLSPSSTCPPGIRRR